jgi:3-methyladenine DNA glycosylase Tag
MVIEDDGEIEMAEAEIIRVLEKIPAYDEEAEMNKKLDKIAESYIPEEI